MSDERTKKINSAIHAADHIPAEKKAKLVGLIARLDPAIAKFAETNQQHAQHITGLVEQSAHAASGKKREHLDRILQELKESVRRIEASHPDLASFVTEYSAFLSALGI
jgi:ABC-type transporter Mla subunit MlaD